MRAFLQDLSMPGVLAGGIVTAALRGRFGLAALPAAPASLSGVSMAGIGSAFWGVAAGAAALAIQNARSARTTCTTDKAPR